MHRSGTPEQNAGNHSQTTSGLNKLSPRQSLSNATMLAPRQEVAEQVFKSVLLEVCLDNLCVFCSLSSLKDKDEAHSTASTQADGSQSTDLRQELQNFAAVRTSINPAGGFHDAPEAGGFLQNKASCASNVVRSSNNKQGGDVAASHAREQGQSAQIPNQVRAQRLALFCYCSPHCIRPPRHYRTH